MEELSERSSVGPVLGGLLTVVMSLIGVSERESIVDSTAAGSSL